jgi:hypothetical protein
VSSVSSFLPPADGLSSLLQPYLSSSDFNREDWSPQYLRCLPSPIQYSHSLVHIHAPFHLSNFSFIPRMKHLLFVSLTVTLLSWLPTASSTQTQQPAIRCLDVLGGEVLCSDKAGHIFTVIVNSNGVRLKTASQATTATIHSQPSSNSVSTRVPTTAGFTGKVPTTSSGQTAIPAPTQRLPSTTSSSPAVVPPTSNKPILVAPATRNGAGTIISGHTTAKVESPTSRRRRPTSSSMSSSTMTSSQLQSTASYATSSSSRFGSTSTKSAAVEVDETSLRFTFDKDRFYSWLHRGPSTSGTSGSAMTSSIQASSSQAQPTPARALSSSSRTEPASIKSVVSEVYETSRALTPNDSSSSQSLPPAPSSTGNSTMTLSRQTSPSRAHPAPIHTATKSSRVVTTVSGAATSEGIKISHSSRTSESPETSGSQSKAANVVPSVSLKPTRGRRPAFWSVTVSEPLMSGSSMIPSSGQDTISTRPQSSTRERTRESHRPRVLLAVRSGKLRHS